jgi:beta-glucosidase
VRRSDLAYWDTRVDLGSSRADALPAAGGGLLGAAAGDGGDGDGALGIDQEGLAKMMGSMPIGRVATFPGSPVGVEHIEQLIAVVNAPQS